ncbi:MAG: OmpH family outer membrane protein [Bacteroidaceae bacterium]|nr:OmpH family outer membrane protein [Bacteroidaceae bacterium]
MRKIVLILMLLPLAASAQLKFGYFNYSEVLHKLPQYKIVQADFDSLLARCDKEIERNEQELTRTYVAFLNEQHDFPEPILRKRQKELQDLVDESIQFRDQVKIWLTEAHDSLFAPLFATIDDAAARVCIHNKLAYIIDTEKSGYVFVNPANGFDVTNTILATISASGEPQTLNATDTYPQEANKDQQEEVIDTEEEAVEDAEASSTATDEVLTEGAMH